MKKLIVLLVLFVSVKSHASTLHLYCAKQEGHEMVQSVFNQDVDDFINIYPKVAYTEDGHRIKPNVMILGVTSVDFKNYYKIELSTNTQCQMYEAEEKK